MNFENLKRPIHEIPDFVEKPLNDHRLIQDFLNRPDYQQNDYIGWINRAKRVETKQKRLNQMLEELDKGGIYMKMDHPASRK